VRSLRLLLLSVALAVVPISSAATSHDKSAQFAEGEVRKVDKETGKITLKHGPIANLDMPAMSMVFQVKDPALLEQVKAGDKVRFQAEKIGTQYTVTHIEPVK
jgi:Cu(I)/Ag(I) efflux system protein CusF